MHVPDGFLNAPTSLATGAVAVAGVAVALRGARRELDDRTAPVAGLVATFVFAGQMMNFPVGAGTSGHLLGGALAAVLAGPYTAVLCISVVLLVQALFMADGGITALGTNITLMAIVGVAVGWFVFKAARAVLPKDIRFVPLAAALGAFVSVPAAASRLHAALRRRRGGADRDQHGADGHGRLAHRDRPRRGGRDRSGGRQRRRRPSRPRPRRPPPAQDPNAGDPLAGGGVVSTRRFLAVGLLLALLVAGVASFYASGHPDGLEYVAEKTGFLHTAEDSPTSDSPLADYSTNGVDDPRLSGGLAGDRGQPRRPRPGRRTVHAASPSR